MIPAGYSKYVIYSCINMSYAPRQSRAQSQTSQSCSRPAAAVSAFTRRRLPYGAAAGREERITLLSQYFPEIRFHLLKLPAGVAADDLLDAAAAAISARRWVSGDVVRSAGRSATAENYEWKSCTSPEQVSIPDVPVADPWATSEIEKLYNAHLQRPCEPFQGLE